ncbi:MAG: phage integrase N-terminal SAM-like domain-containing protein [Methylococcales bacterium]|nr:phage integrase N-terminal SAM-like domain-containing protein [Methylococcales bacterium]
MKEMYTSLKNTNTPHGDGPKLLDRVHNKIRLKHHPLRTGNYYCGWIKRYILFRHKHYPNEIGADGVEAFLSH